jgi:tRNA (Thr-GGU) A37 N-methylase
MQDEKNCRDTLSFAPIGIIHSPFTDVTGMPIQPNGARGIRGTVEIFEKFKESPKAYSVNGWTVLFVEENDGIMEAVKRD